MVMVTEQNVNQSVSKPVGGSRLQLHERFMGWETDDLKPWENMHFCGLNLPAVSYITRAA